jgi:hypothetical protein
MEPSSALSHEETHHLGAITHETAARAAWARLVDHLDGIRKSSGAELLAYPQPATECDLHYRDLLERRRDVNAELSALREDPAPDAPDAAWRARFLGRLTASAFADDALRAEIARLLAKEDAPI